MLNYILLPILISISMVLVGCSSSSSPDNAAPVINIELTSLPDGVREINGEIFVEINSNLSPPPATATDLEDGNLTAQINIQNNVNLTQVGTYSLIYSVSDKDGGDASITLKVNVIDSSVQQPTISLIGEPNVTTQVNTVYNDPGATALDAQDGNLNSSISITENVNSSIIGFYTVTYAVTDSDGNSVEITRTVQVNDTIPPILNLTGNFTTTNPYNWPSGFAFVEPGFTVADNSGEDLSNSVNISGNLNTNVVGLYTLNYQVADSSGRSTQKSRIVNVYDSSNQPVITIAGSFLISIEVGSNYVEPIGLSASDAQDGDITANIIITNNVNSSIIGNYTVQYNVTDSENNAAFTVTRFVNVVDGTPPTLTKVNNNEVLCSPFGTGGILSGVLSSDNVDGDLSQKVKIVSPIDFTIAGVHTAAKLEVSDQSGNTTTINSDIRVGQCYDIVYVRYPDDPTDGIIAISQGEQPYFNAPGADLILLREDGVTEEVLVDCDVSGINNCNVIDPFISYDGKTVFYSFTENVTEDVTTASSWIYKINLDDPNFKPIRLTFDTGFDSKLHAGNITADDDFGFWTNIRDMAPVPLADGRILFTSTRRALVPFNVFTKGVDEPVSQMYVMDDHDGSAITPELANMHVLESGSLHMVQHPIQLKDGRILFSSWQDVATKFNYAMTNLMTVHPDGSNLQQFTEPHNHQKMIDHFITQLSSGDVTAGLYYPSYDFGYGLIIRLPLDPDGPDFLRDHIPLVESPNGTTGVGLSKREFDRKGTVNMTTHSTSADIPAPNRSGKYAMPSGGPLNQMLVAYSTGYVNYFQAACNRAGLPNTCEGLKSGIYLIPNADNAIIDDPAKLIRIKDEPGVNEIWPRAVLSYKDMYGQDKPNILPSLMTQGNQDSRISVGEASAMVGTSSMYYREPLNESNPDPFESNIERHLHDGNWLIQGAEAGVFNNTDIYGVRLIATPSTPFTSPVPKAPFILRHLPDARQAQVPQRFGAYHHEKWEILGEFPLAHKDKTDLQLNPDSSWLAKIPSDVPMLIQTIDKKGLTLTSELTWRALKSGELRADCGGCHVHSLQPLDFSTTETGKKAPLTGIPGITDNDLRIQQGHWDLTTGTIPILADNGSVSFVSGGTYGVEFYRDIKPILSAKCASCHSSSGTTTTMPLDGTTAENDAWAIISFNPTQPAAGERRFSPPQKSKYIRIPQARQSLLAWVVWGERLDGRLNSLRDDDIDYTDAIRDAHLNVITNLSDKEKRDISRWIDLGGPTDFETGTEGFGYTGDPHLPVVHIQQPNRFNQNVNTLIVGFNDAHSGLDFSSLKVEYYSPNIATITNLTSSGLTNTVTDSTFTQLDAAISNSISSIPFNLSDINDKNVLSVALPSGMQPGNTYIIRVTIKDKVGNIGLASVKFQRN